MTHPTNRSRTLLAIAALLLIPAAALRVMFSPVHPKPLPAPGSAAPADSTPPASSAEERHRPAASHSVSAVSTALSISPAVFTSMVPLPRIQAGASTQSEFTLAGVTALDARENAKPPEAIAALPSAHAEAEMRDNPTISAAGAGTGLWIQVRGGLGFQVLTVPEDGRRHLYPLGHSTLAVQTLLHAAGYSTQWVGPGGMPMSFEPPPYSALPGFETPTGQVGTQKITLVPTSFSPRFQITAQALSASGQALGGPVRLLYQPFNAMTLFAQIPAGYSAKTQQFRVTVVRTAAKGKSASWMIAPLPPAVQNGPDTLPLAETAHIGPYLLHAVAAEAEDICGVPDFSNQNRDTSTGFQGPYAQNMDGHGWTGVPTIRYHLTARTLAAPQNQSWSLQLDHVTPQWSAPPAAPLAAAATFVRPPDFFSLTHSYLASPSGQWQLQDGEVGIAYPRQQHWIKFDGTAIRSDSHSETVTFHNAEIIHDQAFGGDRVVWKQSQAVTTPSGITVMVLNAHPGTRGSGAAPPNNPANSPYGSQSWWYDRGNAEMILAWKLPRDITPGNQAKPDSPRVADLPLGTGPTAASVDSQRPTPYALKINPPGGLNARALQQAGWTFMRFSIWTNQQPKRTMQPFFVPSRPSFVPPPIPRPVNGKPPRPLPLVPPPPVKPEVLPPYSWREGAEIVTAQPLPRHLKTLTFQILVQAITQKAPFHLVVPVRATLPPEIGAAATPQQIPSRNPRPASRISVHA